MKSQVIYASLVSILLWAGAAQGAEMTLYQQPDFAGRHITLRGNAPNLARMGFAGQASSVVVASGRWEVCTQPDFKGDCIVLERGEYPTLERRFNHRIESAREVAGYAQRRDSDNRRAPAIVRPAQPSAPTGGSSYTPNTDIELFRGANFGNGAMATQRDMSQLDEEFDRKTSSAIVYAGRWQLCTERDYGGRCVVYGPGRYPDLGALNNQVASLRKVR